MCGIAGYLGPAHPEVLQAMSAAIIHRGPDDCGLHIGEGFGLAHRRLSIIDLEGGKQPMFSPQGDVLVFNGEIYNFAEIRSELEQLGHHFITRSDTEVLLQAYRQWGQQCLQRLRGMFVFALWDAGKREMFIARDRVGIKPLYYADHANVCYFASEAKALLEIPGFPRQLNHEALPLYMTFRYTPGDQTLFAGIKKLLPGHCMTLKPGRETVNRRYWQLNFEPDTGPQEASWKERFWATFEEAVRLRMISDVPLGAYLSGGLDSSLIIAAMSGLSTSPVETFSVGFREQKFDESAYARQVAAQFGCHHHQLSAEQEAGNILDRVIYHLDEPLADLATIPTFLMARETKPHVTVVLSGEGADELLAGYPKYRAFLWSRKVAPFLPDAAYQLGPRLTQKIALQRALASLGERDRARSYLNLAAVFSPAELSLLMAVPSDDGSRAAEQIVRDYFVPGLDGLSQLLNLDFHTWLPDDLLLKNDKMTMAHGVEARVPYLDHKLVELCATIPSHFKLRWNQEKVLLRKVMAGRLPAAICQRKKTGFSVPLTQWLKGPIGEQIKVLFEPEAIAAQGLFNLDYLQSLKSKPLNDPYYRRQFWTIAALGLWQRRFEVEF
jgi:asparagine synthase (glutamine-hydrolysing)